MEKKLERIKEIIILGEASSVQRKVTQIEDRSVYFENMGTWGKTNKKQKNKIWGFRFTKVGLLMLN